MLADKNTKGEAKAGHANHLNVLILLHRSGVLDKRHVLLCDLNIKLQYIFLIKYK